MRKSVRDGVGNGMWNGMWNGVRDGERSDEYAVVLRRTRFNPGSGCPFGVPFNVLPMLLVVELVVRF